MANIWQIYCKVQDSCYGNLMHFMASIMLLHVPTDHYIIGDLKSVRSTALSPFRSFFQRTRKVLVYFGAFSGAFLASHPPPPSTPSLPLPQKSGQKIKLQICKLFLDGYFIGLMADPDPVALSQFFGFRLLLLLFPYMRIQFRHHIS